MLIQLGLQDKGGPKYNVHPLINPNNLIPVL